MPLTKVASSMLASGASGSGGSTGKNYISSYNNGTCNGDFESGSISGWSVFSVSSITNGLPSGAPTTISAGGSNPDITLVSPESQLAGQYSLQASFPISTSANKGFISNIFTIDSEDKAKVLAFKFYYQLTSAAANVNFSGTSSNTFLVSVYAVDGTNIGWLQPAGVYSMTQTSGAGIATGTFQTYSDTTQYRFAVICLNNPTTTAATVTFDDFQVGPQTAPIGAPMTDWQSYTPSTSGLGTISAVNMYWRRVGSDVEIMGTLTTGDVTTSPSEARIGLPAGLTSTSTIATIQQAGTVVLGTATSSYRNLLIETSKTYLTVGVASASSQLTKQNGSTFANTVVLSFQASVPIAGWSANVQTSDQTDTRVVSAVMQTQASNYTLPSSGDITWSGGTIFDTHGAFNGTTSYVVPVSGIYQIGIEGANTSANTYFWVYKNGTQLATSFGVVAYGTSTSIGSGYLVDKFNAGDILTIRSNSAGSTILYYSASTYRTTWSVTRLSGPSAIAASETVAAKYSGAIAATVSTTAPFQWNTKQFDTHNAVTTGANWRFISPISGTYRVSAVCAISASVQDIVVYKNGSVTPSTLFGANATYSLSGSISIQLLAGEFIDVRPQTGSHTSVAGTNYSISIERIGN